MKRFAISILAILLFVPACGVNGPLPRYESHDSVIDYSESLVRKTTPRNLDRLFDTVDTGSSDGYRWLRGWWCPRHPDVGNVFDVRGRYVSYCSARGGTYDSSGICRDSRNGDSALFVANASETSECSGGPTVTLDVVEPTADIQARTYIERIRRYGYETSTERSNRQNYEAALAAVNAESVRQARETELAGSQLERAALMTSPLGSRICKAGMFDYVITTGTISSSGKAAGHLIAQLDGFSDSKERLRFRVLAFDIPSRRGHVAPFASDPKMGEFFATPGVVYWDRTSAWVACD